jgi:tetratricopeptide (TPR) repeat protein
MLADPLGESIEHGLDRVVLAKLFEDLGNWETAARLYERGLEQNLPEADFWQAVKRLSLLQRRRGDLESAVQLWERAAADGHVYAFVELAKYCEHHARDFVSALDWTDKAMERVKELDIPRYEYNHWMEELEHRRERLEGKAGKE